MTAQQVQEWKEFLIRDVFSLNDLKLKIIYKDRVNGVYNDIIKKKIIANLLPHSTKKEGWGLEILLMIRKIMEAIKRIKKWIFFRAIDILSI